jgi:hypothetical protein
MTEIQDLNDWDRQIIEEFRVHRESSFHSFCPFKALSHPFTHGKSSRTLIIKTLCSGRRESLLLGYLRKINRTVCFHPSRKQIPIDPIGFKDRFIGGIIRKREGLHLIKMDLDLTPPSIPRYFDGPFDRHI